MLSDLFAKRNCRTLSIKLLFLAAVVFSIYSLLLSEVSLQSASGCRKKIDFRNLWNAQNSLRPFENDVLLEYNSFESSPNKTENANGHNKNDTRSENSSSVLLKLAQAAHGIVSNKSHLLLTCEKLQVFWLGPDYAKFKTVRDEKVNGNMGHVVVKTGITKFFGPTTFKILTKEVRNTSSLYNRFYGGQKNRYLNKIEGFPEILGACFIKDYVRLVFRVPEGVLLCSESRNEQNKDFQNTLCFGLANMHNVIRQHHDPGKSALTIARNLVCLVGELEVMNLFIEDIHGSSFTLLPDLTIVINDLDNLFHYDGKRNIFGETLCWKHFECPQPMGVSWGSNSANTFAYKNCHDHVPLCSRNRCVGFNASLHLCGFSNWILTSLLVHMTSPQSKQRLQTFIDWLKVPYAEVRKSGKQACAEMNEMISKYEVEKQRNRGNNKRVFHLG